MALADMARFDGRNPVSLRDISLRQSISLLYLEQIFLRLKKNNIFFAGIDIIGNYLTEINITSPTGIQEINRLNNSKLEKIFWNKIEAKIK